MTTALFALGWLVFGPRRQTSLRIVGDAVIFPVLFFVLSFGAVALDRRLPGVEPDPAV